ncbi:MAG: tetratricopeptide repeat protein, partial [archaeon]|nr:tetratricopeptide repeat protein [archaeon]
MTDVNQGKNMSNNVDEHIAQLKNALLKNEECGTTHYNLAVAYMGKQEYAEAENELHEAIDCSPSLAEAYVLLGGICLQRKDLEGCFRFNQRATKARAGFAEGY